MAKTSKKTSEDANDTEPIPPKAKTKSKAVKSKSSTRAGSSKDTVPKPKKGISTPPTGTKQKRKRGALPTPAGTPPRKIQKTGSDPKLARLIELDPDELLVATKDLSELFRPPKTCLLIRNFRSENWAMVIKCLPAL